MSDVTGLWLFVGGLFTLGAAAIGALRPWIPQPASRQELWRYYRSELGIVAAVLVPASVSARAFMLLALVAWGRCGWEIWRTARQRGDMLAAAVLAQAVLAAGVMAMASIAMGTQGLFWLTLLFVCTEMQDAMAFVFGRAIGRTPLAPRLSPRKTVEGALAGLAFGVGAGTAFALAFGLAPPGTAVLVSLLATLAGFCGDLITSAFKRRAGVKDFPAVHVLHGGLTDIYDSLLFAAVPVAVAVAWLGRS